MPMCRCAYVRMCVCAYVRMSRPADALMRRRTGTTMQRRPTTQVVFNAGRRAAAAGRGSCACGPVPAGCAATDKPIAFQPSSYDTNTAPPCISATAFTIDSPGP
ncbi:hypothetical protein DM45_2557 [Burkholderia mallei]|nr:hypothetical protein DM45_2557 [Burkholderia mallei]